MMSTRWLIALSYLLTVVNCMSSHVDITVQHRLQEMEEHMRLKLEEYKKYLKSIFGEHPAFEEQRPRRTPNETSSYIVPGSEDLPAFDKIEAQPSTYDKMKDENFLVYIHYRNSSYLLMGTKTEKLSLYSKDLMAIIVSSKISGIPYKAQYFEYESNLWLVVLCSINKNQQHFVSLYKVDVKHKSLQHKQNITCEGRSDLKLVTIENEDSNIHYLVISTYNKKIGDALSYCASTSLYKWADVQFDNVDKVDTCGAISVSAWIMDRHLHVIIAQERDDNNSPVASPFYVYNEHQNRLILIEYVQTIKPKKVKHMNVRNNTYVIFLSEENLSIYSWTGSGFTEWKTFKELDAIDVDVIQLTNGEAIIAVATKKSILFYTEFTYTIVSAGELEVSETVNISFFDPTLPRLLITDEDGDSRIYDLTFHSSEYSDDMDYIDPLVSCILELLSKLTLRAKHIDYMLWNISRVWRYDLEQKVDAELIVEGHLNVSNVTMLGKVELFSNGDGPTFDYEDAISKTTSTLENLKEEMNTVVYKSTEQLITGRIEFERSVETRDVTISNISRDVFINGISVERLNTHALKTSGDQIITGNITLTSLSIENLTLNGAVNGLRTEDLFLLCGSQSVKGSITFADIDVDKNIKINGHINGIFISDMVTVNRYNNIQGVKTFTKLAAEEISVKNFVNGQNLSSIAEKAVYLVRDNNISENILIDASISIEHLILNTLINGQIDIERLIKEGVTTDTEQTIVGKKTFLRSVQFSKDLNVKGTWNDIHLNSLITTSTNQTIYGKVVFKMPIYINTDLRVDTVNSIKLKDEAVLSFGQQTILSKKHFLSSLAVKQNITLGRISVINKIKPWDLAKLVNEILRGVPGYNNITITGKVLNETFIYGLNIWSKSLTQKISVPVQFAKSVIIDGNLHVNNINGYLMEDFVKTSDNSVIRGKLTFLDDTHVTSDVIFLNGVTLNGFDLSETKEDIYLKQNTKILGKKTLQSLFVNGNVETDKMNNKSPEDILLKTSQKITGNVKFKEVIVVRELLGHNLTAIKANGSNLSEFIEDLVMKDADTKILSSKTFKSLKVLKNIIANGSIDGVSIKDFVSSVVTLNTPQKISPKHFLGSVIFKGPLSLELLNKFHKNFTKQIVLDDTNIISGKMTITGNVAILGRAETKLVNDVDIEDLKMNAFSKSKPNFFTKRVTFWRTVEIGTLTVEAGINDVNPNHLILVNSTRQFEKVTFTTSVSTAGIELQGLINSCNLTSLLKNAIPTFVSWQNLTVVKQIDFLETSDIFVQENINGLNIMNLVNYSNRGWKNVKNGVYHFRNINAKRLLVKNKVNEVNLAFLLEDAVWKHVEQKITGEKRFLNEGGVIFENNLRIYGDMCLEGSVNEIPWSDLVRTAVNRYENQTIFGTKKIKNLVTGSMVMHGSLNSVRIPKDVLVTTRNEYFGATAYFTAVEIRGNLAVHGSVDGVSLHNFIKHRITLTSEQDIGNIKFLSDIYVLNNLRIVGKVNGFQLVDIFTSTKRVLESTFTNDLTILGDLNVGFVNSYNFTSLASTIVTTVEDVIVEQTVVRGPAKFYNLTFTDFSVTKFMDMVGKMDYLRLYLASIGESWNNMIVSYNKEVSYHRETESGKICGFAHFILITEIPSLPVWRFLAVYNSSVLKTKDPDNIIAWASNHLCYGSHCCRNYTTNIFSFDTNSFGAKPLKGRYYPLLLPENLTPSIYDKAFLIRTTSPSKECQLEEGSTVILSLNTNYTHFSQMEAYIYEEFIVPTSPDMESLKLFAFEGNLYLVLASSQEKYPHINGSTTIYKYNTSWSEHQKLSTKAALSIDVISNNQVIYLAVAANLPTMNCTDQALVYKLNRTTTKFDQVVPVSTSYASSVLFVKRNKLYLIVGHNAPYGKDLGFKHPLLVYLNYRGKFNIVHSLKIYNVVSLQAFSLSGEDYILAADAVRQCVHVLQWKGYSLLKKIQSVSAYGIRSILAYWMKKDLYVAIASSSSHSKIIKAVIRGTPIHG